MLIIRVAPRKLLVFATFEAVLNQEEIYSITEKDARFPRISFYILTSWVKKKQSIEPQINLNQVWQVQEKARKGKFQLRKRTKRNLENENTEVIQSILLIKELLKDLNLLFFVGVVVWL